MATPAKAREAAASANEDLVDAKAALALLGIKPQTLYAYVSRGLIRAVNRPGVKANLYYRQDLESLQQRGRTSGARRNIAEGALRVGGSAILQTSITAISPQGPRYRGVAATEMAQMGRRFEDCVELLWSGMPPTPSAQSVNWAPLVLPDTFRAFAGAIAATATANNSRRIFSLCTEALASCSGEHAEQRAGAATLAARSLIQVMVGAFGYLRPKPAFAAPREDEPLAVSLCRSLGLAPRPEHVQLLDAVLIICADHELAPSTFAARIAASAGADIYSCVSSALGAFEGMHTGLGCDLAERSLREASTPARYVESLAATAAKMRPLPGYNHPLYPDGDPRAAHLMRLLRQAAAANPRAARVVACISAAQNQLKAMPSLSVALAGVVVAYELPLRSSGALMALGRAAGWIAHTLEQRLAGFLVRPHAEYIGPASQPMH